MSKTIQPLLDFSTGTPQAADGGRNPHTAVRTTHNDLGPVKFNEYERVLVVITDVIDDYEFSVLTGSLGSLGASDTISSAIKRLWIHLNNVHDAKFDKVGGAISGDTTITASTDGGGLSVNGRVSSDSIDVEWQSNTWYEPGDVVRYDTHLYRCAYASGKESGSTFVDELGEWDEVRGDGKIVYSASHGFTVGTPVYYSSGYHEAIADDFDTSAIAVVTEVLNSDYVRIQGSGFFSSVTSLGFTANTQYYTSDTEVGGVTTSPNWIYNPVFYAISDRAAFVNIQVAHGTVIPRVYTVSGDGTNEYALPYDMEDREFGIVSVQGVVQQNDSWSLSTDKDTIIFSSGIPSDCEIEVKWMQVMNWASLPTRYLHSSGSVDTVGTFNPTHKVQVYISGTPYWMQLEEV